MTNPQTAPTPHREPREYSDEEKRAIVERVCEKVAEGGVGNTFKAASEAEGIGRRTLFRWVHENKALRELYQSARIWQAHSTAEDAIDLADTAIGGKDGNVDKVRLQVDTRKWYASKIAPKLYGDKLELTGANGVPLVPTAPTRVDLSKLSLDQLEQLAAITAVATVVVEQPQLQAPVEDSDGR
jgi:hypothetical protein